MHFGSLAEFLQRLETLPWFANIGQPIEGENLRQIHDWSEWPGPEHPPVEKYFLRQQEWYDAVMGVGTPPADLQAIWDQADALVHRQAEPTIPYDPNEDAWHGPTLAVWHAAYTASLIAVYVHLGREVPPGLVEEWGWFEKGHWPCGYKGLYVDDEPTGLLVY